MILQAKIPALNECDPGFRPTEYNVVVIPEATEEVTKGGIILAQTLKEKEELASVRGRLVAASPLAFSYSEDWSEGERPKAGDAVIFAKYAGTLIKGRDGKEYRLCKDKDIAAVVEE